MQMKPLILPFKTTLGYYFYETQRNEIVSVNKELYQYIEAIMKDKVSDVKCVDESIKKQYDELVSFGYLASGHIKQIEHPFTEWLDIALERRVERILLQVTQSCNLRCEYCVYSEEKNFNTRSHTNNFMDFETAKRAVDFYAQHSIDEKEKAIGFYGGEPLLNFEVIKKVIDYANTVFRGQDIIYSITTNGTLFTDEIIEFFVKNDVKITVSLDGPKEIHDLNRKFKSGKGSFDTVLSNLNKLKKAYKESPFSISMVIDPDNNYDDIVKIFEEPVLKNINLIFSIVEENEITKPYSDDFYAKFERDLFLGYISYFRDEEKKINNKIIAQEIAQLNHIDDFFKTRILFEKTAPAGPCIPGKMRLFIDCYGNLFPCERVSETAKDMKIGTIDTGFDINKINKLLNISKLTEEACKACWAFSLCSVCAKYAISDNSLCANKKIVQCTYAKNMAEAKLLGKILIYENQEHEKKMTKLKESFL